MTVLRAFGISIAVHVVAFLAVGLLLLLVISFAHAADSPVPDSLPQQDWGNVSFICEIAARSPAIPIEQVATIAQFCVQWKARMKAAAEATAKQGEK